MVLVIFLLRSAVISMANVIASSFCSIKDEWTFKMF
jgi:hypothetical protein